MYHYMELKGFVEVFKRFLLGGGLKYFFKWVERSTINLPYSYLIFLGPTFIMIAGW